MKKAPWLMLVAAALLASLVYAMSGGFSRGAPVTVAVAKRDNIREFIDEQAKTRLPETNFITMPFAGRIRPIELTEGMKVQKGQTVAWMVPEDLKLAVDQASAAVERIDASIRENADVAVEETAFKQAEQFVKSTVAAVKAATERIKAGEAQFNYAAHDLERVQKLAATGAQSRDELEKRILLKIQSEVDYRQDELVHAGIVAMAAATDLMPTMVSQYIQHKSLTGRVLAKQKAEAEAHLAQVQQDRERGTMRSPADGVVLERFVSNEGYVPAGTRLLEIGQPEEMEVEADILTLDVVVAKVGDAVEIYGPAIGRLPVRGKVARIFPAGFTKVSSLGVEQQRVKVVVHFDSKDDLKRLVHGRGLGVGYRVRVRIFTADKSQALLVPRSALFRAVDEKWQVFAVRGGVARLQTVEVGLMNDEQAEIRVGLADGESVVLAPESSLVDGMRVDASREH
jgi:HlyD family secretion protein